MKRRRKKRHNPGGFWAWASAHPWLTVLFVLPTIVAVPIALFRVLRPPALPPAPPAPKPFPPDIPIV